MHTDEPLRSNPLLSCLCYLTQKKSNSNRKPYKASWPGSKPCYRHAQVLPHVHCGLPWGCPTTITLCCVLLKLFWKIPCISRFEEGLWSGWGAHQEPHCIHGTPHTVFWIQAHSYSAIWPGFQVCLLNSTGIDGKSPTNLKQLRD